MRVLYVKEHANYPFGIGYEYDASKYKEGWLMIDGQLWREDCFRVIEENNANKIEEDTADVANNLSDLNSSQIKELEGYIEQLITLKSYVDIFIAQHNLDEDEVMEKFEKDFDEAMSRQHG